MKECFIIMPIGKPGTDDHTQFSAISDHIKSNLEGMGFNVTRADDVQASGAITKDIVTRLGASELVVADLTDLNPNVFYELGVRHALRGNGTIMILDEGRTPQIPFDLSAYRVLKYVGKLGGMKSLDIGLRTFVQEQESASEASRDNPVHDWFPTLPLDLIEHSGQSKDASLRRTIKDLQERLKRFEKAYGSDSLTVVGNSSPLEQVLSALSDAEDGLLPTDIMASMNQSFEDRDSVALLQKIRLLMERNIRLSADMFLDIAGWLSVLDMSNVRQAIYDQAMQFHPNNRHLKGIYLGTLAQSELLEERDKARSEIPKFIRIDLSETEMLDYDLESLSSDILLVGVLVDSMQIDGMHEEGAKLAKKMLDLFPKDSRVLRNYGRALTNLGDPKKGLEYYREAALLPDSNDTAAIWLGNQLHNRSQHQLALESYALACKKDFSDADNFAHFVSELSICLDDVNSDEATGTEESVAGLTKDDVMIAASCAASCPNFSADAASRIRRAFESQDISIDDITNQKTRMERRQESYRLYTILKTELTTPGSTIEML